MYKQIRNHAIVFKTLTSLPLLLVLILDSRPVAAQPSCEKLYTQLSKELDSVIEDNNPESRFSGLHGLEDKLFVGFESCAESPLLYTLMGEVQISLNNIGLALLYARKSMKLNGSYWQPHHLLGNTLCMLEEYDEGLVHLEKAARLAPGKPELEFNLCSSYLAAKKPDQAISACSKVLKRKDHQLHGPAYFTRGKAHEQLEDLDKAQQDFDNAKVLGYSPSK